MLGRLRLDEAKYRFYMRENENWQNTIQAQVKEIPEWEKMLEIVEKKAEKVNSDSENKNQDIHFFNQIIKQQREMNKINEDIDEQQNRLSKDCEFKYQYDIDAFCTQDILRERIKALEKTYIDLKCNFMNYLSNIS